MLTSNSPEFLFSISEVENFRPDTSSRLRHYFNFIRENHMDFRGDIVEFGVFRGASLVATALLLKELGSNKKVYGFDSFSGFPNYSSNDDLEAFSSENGFDKETLDRVAEYQNVMSQLWDKEIDGSSASSSGDFSNTSSVLVQRKLNFFQLDNVKIIEGNFAESVREKSFNDMDVMCANIDCDLYDGYQDSMEFIWHKLERGGFVHLDEYYSLKFPGAKIAVDEFCRKYGISVTEQISRNGEFPRVSLNK